MSEEGGAIRLSKGSLTVAIIPVEGRPETDDAALAHLLAPERAVDRTLVASLGRFTEEARRLAMQRKVQLWDRAQLEEEVGRMVMGELDSRPAASADDSLLEPFLSGRVGELFADKVSGRQATEGPQGPSVPQARMEIPDGEAMVGPAISLEQVRNLVSETLEGAFRFDLQLMPHYCFSYIIDIEGPDGLKESRAGGILVNAVSGEAGEWRPDGTPEKLEPGRARMEPSIERSDAVRKALEKAVALNTRVVNLRQEKRSVTVYEKRTLRPSEEAVRLELKGMLFLPVWCVEGANGAAVLDAVTGQKIKEELFDVHPATLEKDAGSRSDGK